ncbi:hypothetical protein RFI_03542 [Reticulomyxa filosa]|uniref:Kelch motif family protein n=1 Tax=Reticulomyxa filosa TaxID=46433 RepID=X6P4U2_RETFI|nr:hypothetical protein RFI_03542 [Reticulomyxa filosa]|eukprot:ETO33560.1 hypothetical protein RFI_03542 [Reticulomyxa filosa]
MAKQITTQNSPETETERSQQITTHFQTLKELPIQLEQSQCVLHKHELLICGCYVERACYSYHTLKDEYKFICEYPSDVKLKGHCVVKLLDSNSNNDKDNNQITLLSFGGSLITKRHTLMMKYVSVWSDDNNNDDENETNKSEKLNDLNRLNKSNNYNQWLPFIDNHNHPLIIGRDQDMFDLNTFQFTKHDTLPAKNIIYYHCFVSKSENGQVQEMIKTNQKNEQNYQMLLFFKDTGLSIEYDEDNNTFQFHQLPVCKSIAPFKLYAYVCINDIILFFGGYNWEKKIYSKSVYKYSIRENEWMTFQNTLPSPLYGCVAILSEEDNHIHIIGGIDDEDTIVSTHMKTKVRVCDPSQLVMVYLFILI